MIAFFTTTLTNCTDTTIWIDPYQTAVTGDNCQCRCPNCGSVHRFHEVCTIRVSPEPRRRDRPFLTPEQVWRLKNLSYRLSREAIDEARVVLKGARDDLRTHVPLQDRHRPYVRSSFKKRVCGGSSRYRVMVN